MTTTPTLTCPTFRRIRSSVADSTNYSFWDRRPFHTSRLRDHRQKNLVTNRPRTPSFWTRFLFNENTAMMGKLQRWAAGGQADQTRNLHSRYSTNRHVPCAQLLYFTHTLLFTCMKTEGQYYYDYYLLC